MEHDYLHELYDRLHDTPMQRKLRKLSPMPIGVVFIQWPEMDEQEIRRHFKTMRELGYTNLKQFMVCPPMTPAHLAKIALEEGIIPWFYDIGGWEDITPQLLEKLGLPPDMDIEEAMAHTVMREYQTGVMQRRIERKNAERAAGVDRSHDFLPAKSDPYAVAGVVHSPEGTKLLPETVPFFIDWLKKTYGSDIEKLKHAWNARSSSFNKTILSWETWNEVAEGLDRVTIREYRHLRDILRFKSDTKLARLRKKVSESHASDPDEPVRAGGEISIFLPHVSWGIDMEGYAEAMAEGGAFYPSMHPGWHLEEVGYELVRPTYMQASMCVDWAKGVWSAPFESSGGPQWWSGGGKVPFVPEVRPLQPGFTFTDGTMAQLICSYLGAGFKGLGIWCWNSREAGWEAGEYALCDRNNEVTPRAALVGKFGQAMQKYRRELWLAHKEPYVGVYQDWENDAMWAALSVSGRDRYKMEPIRARIGAARVLINGNIPWEHVTFRQIEKGLAPRYRSIYLPAVISFSPGLMELLLSYVEQGGRVVLDMPGAYLDERGHLLDTRRGSLFEQLFGVVLHEYGYVNNIKTRIGELELTGFTAVMTPTQATVVETYDTGGPAITENRIGKGTAVVFGADSALACVRPGNAAMEQLVAKILLNGAIPLFRCEGALVYRLAAPGTDHYFLVNDGPARTVSLTIDGHLYNGASDAVTGAAIDLAAIELAADNARWIRCLRFT